MSREKTGVTGFVLKAEEIHEDRIQMDNLVERVRKILFSQKSGLRKVMAKILIMIRLLKSYSSGRYRQISASRIILIVAALLYIVSPFDAVFDFLPGGYLDDAAIVAWLFNLMRIELDLFQDWEEEESKKSQEEYRFG